MASTGPTDPLCELNDAQRRAACFAVVDGGIDPESGPLLVVAGAGTGKTTTLAHRVGHLIARGADPHRMLLLTFTRRAASELERRAQAVARRASARGRSAGALRWAGTFHSVGNRLLRLYAEPIGLDPSFTVVDRSDAADLMGWLRGGLGLAGSKSRFPSKQTCLSIYSHVTNAQSALEDSIEGSFSWCASWTEELRELFAAYVAAKQERSVLDYDDLLLYWHAMLEEPALAAAVRERFDCVLVDEYQDTNRLQAELLQRLVPSGCGLTVVGDDAQAIYAFRGATVRNILDFPGHFERPATVVTLEENYRAHQPLLQVCNAVIAAARERHAKTLFSRRRSGAPPVLVCAEDEDAQVAYVVRKVLEHREAGIDLRRQAVLFRTAHHSDALEVELGRRQIPFVKFGGLKFLEAAHVKDLLCLLRWAENPRDSIAGFRVLQLLPGVGPATASRAIECLVNSDLRFQSLAKLAPRAAAEPWRELVALLTEISEVDRGDEWSSQVGRVREWYAPLLERLYDAPQARLGDLDQLEQVASTHATREQFLSDLSLDPPNVTGDFAGAPRLDDDYLVLSTIHSSKGQEWDAVFVIQAADGAIPSDLATRRSEDIEEERRLLYVAMTRAREALHVVHPQRMFIRSQARTDDAHVYAPRTRFITDEMASGFERRAEGRSRGPRDLAAPALAVRVDVAARLRARWVNPG